ncbi:MAG: 16S rRNA (cytidine(1402)-2'-O)-methyltransferase [Sphaerochaeta sp.]
MGTLYMVATPIGNLQDITLRALDILKSVDIIACEDTRHTQKLLNNFEIKKRLIATHSYNEAASAKGIVDLLDSGNNIAFCSDAGTPGVSDPGARLANIVRKAGFDVVPLPGANAATTLISAAGYVGKTFTFEGFLSPKSGRRKKRLEVLLERDEAFIIYESPFRVLKTLKEISGIAGDRIVVVGRELTKQYEEIIRGTADELVENFESRQSIKGEFAICVCPIAAGIDKDSEEDSK